MTTTKTILTAPMARMKIGADNNQCVAPSIYAFCHDWSNILATGSSEAEDGQSLCTTEWLSKFLPCFWADSSSIEPLSHISVRMTPIRFISYLHCLFISMITSDVASNPMRETRVHEFHPVFASPPVNVCFGMLVAAPYRCPGF